MAEYLEHIRANFFEPINSCKIINVGWTNLVFENNEEWIFRFVRDSSNQQIVIEQNFLPRFAEVSPVKIPEIVISDRNYIAYRKILGERFSPEKFLLFSNSQKTELFKLLGRFLTCLHNFQYSHQYLSSAPYGGGDFWNDLWILVKDNLTTQTRNKAEQYFIKIQLFILGRLDELPY